MLVGLRAQSFASMGQLGTVRVAVAATSIDTTSVIQYGGWFGVESGWLRGLVLDCWILESDMRFAAGTVGLVPRALLNCLETDLGPHS